MTAIEITNMIIGSGGILGVAVIVFRFGKLVQKVDDIATSLKETNHKIDKLDSRLTGQIDALDDRLTGQIGEVDYRLSTKIDKLSADINEKFEKVDGHLIKIDGRLDRVEVRLDHVETRLDKVDIRLEKLDINLHGVEVQLARLETRFEERDEPTVKEFIKNFVFRQKSDFPQVFREEKQPYITSEDSI